MLACAMLEAMEMETCGRTSDILLRLNQQEMVIYSMLVFEEIKDFIPRFGLE